MKQTIFITGASSGLGKATATLFANKGWRVIATMRNPENESDLSAWDDITLMPLDVTDPEQIKAAVQEATATGEIDVVFNNAGYGLGGAFEAATDAQITRQIDTNLLGVMRVTQAFIPHFREKKSGVFIATTSIGGLMAFPFFSVYHATKWALEGWSESLAFELEGFGILVKTVSPGGIATDFAGRSLDMSTHEAYEENLQNVIGAMTSPERQKQYSTAEQIADVVYEAATDGQSTLRYVAGEDAKAMYAQRIEVGDEVFRTGIKEMLSG